MCIAVAFQDKAQKHSAGLGIGVSFISNVVFELQTSVFQRDTRESVLGRVFTLIHEAQLSDCRT